MGNEHFKMMPDKLKNQLVFAVLKGYYDLFFFFFQDLELNHQSEENFIRRVLTNLDCQIFDSGSLSTSIIVRAGKDVENIYFVQRNKVDVIDAKQLFVLATLPEGSWFGDFNSFFRLKSKYNYTASSGG